MSLSYKIWDFPSVPIQEQLFYVPGAMFDGGFTSGGARISSPEPAGRSRLELKIAFQVREWQFPFSSWLMSKTNGQIFRIQLTKTPQLLSPLALLGLPVGNPIGNKSSIPWATEGFYAQGPWDNAQNWLDDGAGIGTNSSALEGTNIIYLNMGTFAHVLTHGHVIGNGDYSYIVDDIDYNGNIAKVTISPPLRKNVAANDVFFIKPYFLGQISNGDEVKATYQASNVGHIQPNRIVFEEIILP